MNGCVPWRRRRVRLYRPDRYEYTSSLPAVLPYVNEVPAGGVGQSAFCDLQSIQVLNGPQGTLFGRNAAGGAVLFTTAKPTEDRTGYGIARFGNVGAVDLEGAGSGAIIPDKLLLRVAGTYNSQNGYQHNLYYDNELGGFQREGKKLGEMSHPPQTPRHLLCLGLKRRCRWKPGMGRQRTYADVAPAPAPERRTGALPEGRNSPRRVSARATRRRKASSSSCSSCSGNPAAEPCRASSSASLDG